MQVTVIVMRTLLCCFIGTHALFEFIEHVERGEKSIKERTEANRNVSLCWDTCSDYHNCRRCQRQTNEYATKYSTDEQCLQSCEYDNNCDPNVCIDREIYSRSYW